MPKRASGAAGAAECPRDRVPSGRRPLRAPYTRHVDLPRTAAVATRLRWLDHADSTNSVLAALAVGTQPWPHGSVVVTDDQTAGRGRLGRVWTAPPGGSLAVSVLLRPEFPWAAWAWLPLLAGVAMADSVRAAGVDAVVKWPNDVLVGERKVCGVLAEALPDGSGAVVGAGLNHALTMGQLPVPTATSLAVLGVTADVDALVADFVGTLLSLVDDLRASGGDAQSSGTRATVVGRCGTLGRRVRVVLPDGRVVVGTAVGLESDGRLIVARDDAASSDAKRPDPNPMSVSAGDVEHLRYE